MYIEVEKYLKNPDRITERLLCTALMQPDTVLKTPQLKSLRYCCCHILYVTILINVTVIDFDFPFSISSIAVLRGNDAGISFAALDFRFIR